MVSLIRELQTSIWVVEINKLIEEEEEEGKATRILQLRMIKMEVTQR